MPRTVALLLAVAAAFGACKPRPPAVVAMEPRPNPPLVRHSPPPDNPRDRLRQNRWLAQFWEELTPSQRRRVERRMRRAQPPVAGDGESAGVAWDGLGLAERDRLVFGGSAPARPASDTPTAGKEAESSAPVR